MMQNRMYRNLFFIGCSVIIALIVTNLLHREDTYNLKIEELKHRYVFKDKPSVNHSLLPELNREFKTPEEVTLACLSCHTETHKEVMASSHWNWERVSYVEGRGISSAGKKNVLNNF